MNAANVIAGACVLVLAAIYAVAIWHLVQDVRARRAKRAEGASVPTERPKLKGEQIAAAVLRACQPAGYWEAFPGFFIPSPTRPSRFQCWTHRVVFGWKWKDAK